MADQRYRLLRKPLQYDDLSKKDSARRLNDDLKTIVDAINYDRLIVELPSLSTISGTFGYSGKAILWWPDVTDDLRKSIDGVRIWRADASEDARTDFNKNDAKQVVVECVRTTKYVDHEVSTGSAYVWWVQVLNRLGVPSKPSSAITGTIS